MSNHNRFGLLAESGFQLRNVDIVLGNRDVNEHRHSTVLQGGRYRSGKTAGHGDDLIASLDLSVSKLRRGERHESY